MKHEKTFEAIKKLQEVEIELHRLKNALEIANKALDAQRTWVGLTDEERKNIMVECESTGDWAWELNAAKAIEAKLKEKNNA